MNRAQRRAIARAKASPQAELPPICPPGQHAFGKVAARVKGIEVASRVVCSKCRRLIEQVFEQQPEELARFKAWHAAGEPDA